VRQDCPDLPRNKKKHDNAEEHIDHAGSAVAFVASFPMLSTASTSSSKSSSSEITWAIDSGASRHYYVVRSDFTHLKTSVVGNVSGIGSEVKGVGDIDVIVCKKAGLPVIITLTEVLYVPDLKERSKGSYLRLLSVRRATQAGCHCTFPKDEDLLDLLTGPPVLLVRSGGLLWLPNFQELTAVPVSPTISRDLVHRRCGYLHEAGFEKLDALGIDGIWGYSSLPPFFFCTHSAIAKSKVSKVNRESTRDRDPPTPFHTIALDIWGPMSTEDIGGNRWFFGGVCFKASTIIGNVMKYKSDAPYTWKTMIASVKFLGYSINRVRIDNDTVFLSKNFRAVCVAACITVERTMPYAHWQLGRMERQWQTLGDGAKTLLLMADLPNRLWGHAFLAMVYIRNRCWSSVSDGIPSELVTGHQPNLSNLRVFGCPAYVYIDVSLRTKFGDKAWKGIFVGYAFDSLAWLVYNPVTRHVIRSKNVIFDEAWRDSLPSSPGPPIPEDDDYGDDYEIVFPHEPQATPENSDAQADNFDVPTRLEQLERDRLDRIIDNPRSRSERA
jgi:hypothetical protein